MTFIDKNTLIKIICLWLVWRLFTLTISVFALNALPFTVTFSNYALQERSTLPVFYERWTNFDGGSYLILSDDGYRKVGLLQAYFPLYPLFIRWTTNLITFGGNWSSVEVLNIRTIVALSISSVFSFAFLVVIFQYLRKRFSDQFVWLFLLIFITFPTSFFLHASYTEPLFLVTTILSFSFFQKKRYVLAALMLILATASRIVGIFLVPAFILDLFLQQTTTLRVQKLFSTITHFLRTNWRIILTLSLGSLGLFSYMSYLWYYFHDPLLFFHVQSEFGAGRQEKIILFPQVVWRYLKIFATARPIDWKYFTYVSEFVTAMSGLVLSGFLLRYLKKYSITFSEVFFSIGAFFLPTLTGNFSSMSRYILVCFPFFILLTHFIQGRKISTFFYFCFSLLLAVINIILFIQGHWVA